MNLTLMTVHDHNADGTVNGMWLQHRSGTTVAEAVQHAKEINEVNGNNLEIAVFPEGAHINTGYMWGVKPLALVKKGAE